MSSLQPNAMDTGASIQAEAIINAIKTARKAVPGIVRLPRPSEDFRATTRELNKFILFLERSMGELFPPQDGKGWTLRPGEIRVHKHKKDQWLTKLMLDYKWAPYQVDDDPVYLSRKPQFRGKDRFIHTLEITLLAEKRNVPFEVLLSSRGVLNEACRHHGKGGIIRRLRSLAKREVLTLEGTGELARNENLQARAAPPPEGGDKRQGRPSRTQQPTRRGPGDRSGPRGKNKTDGGEDTAPDQARRDDIDDGLFLSSDTEVADKRDGKSRPNEDSSMSSQAQRPTSQTDLNDSSSTLRPAECIQTCGDCGRTWKLNPFLQCVCECISELGPPGRCLTNDTIFRVIEAIRTRQNSEPGLKPVIIVSSLTIINTTHKNPVPEDFNLEPRSTVLVPVYHPHHWSLVKLARGTGKSVTVSYYDSSPLKQVRDQHFTTVSKALGSWLQRRKLKGSYRLEKCPQQRDNTSCGVFTLSCIRFLTGEETSDMPQELDAEDARRNFAAMLSEHYPPPLGNISSCAGRSTGGDTEDRSNPGGNDKADDGKDDGDGSATPRLKRKQSPTADASFGDGPELGPLLRKRARRLRRTQQPTRGGPEDRSGSGAKNKTDGGEDTVSDQARRDDIDDGLFLPSGTEAEGKRDGKGGKSVGNPVEHQPPPTPNPGDEADSESSLLSSTSRTTSDKKSGVLSSPVSVQASPDTSFDDEPFEPGSLRKKAPNPADLPESAETGHSEPTNGGPSGQLSGEEPAKSVGLEDLTALLEPVRVKPSGGSKVSKASPGPPPPGIVKRPRGGGPDTDKTHHKLKDDFDDLNSGPGAAETDEAEDDARDNEAKNDGDGECDAHLTVPYKVLSSRGANGLAVTDIPGPSHSSPEVADKHDVKAPGSLNNPIDLSIRTSPPARCDKNCGRTQDLSRCVCSHILELTSPDECLRDDTMLRVINIINSGSSPARVAVLDPMTIKITRSPPILPTFNGIDPGSTVLIPVFHPGHWSLVRLTRCLMSLKVTAHYYNSIEEIPGGYYYWSIRGVLSSWLQERGLEAKYEEVVKEEKCPHQSDTVSCGVYVLFWIIFLAGEGSGRSSVPQEELDVKKTREMFADMLREHYPRPTPSAHDEHHPLPAPPDGGGHQTLPAPSEHHPSPTPNPADDANSFFPTAISTPTSDDTSGLSGQPSPVTPSLKSSFGVEPPERKFSWRLRERRPGVLPGSANTAQSKGGRSTQPSGGKFPKSVRCSEDPTVLPEQGKAEPSGGAKVSEAPREAPSTKLVEQPPRYCRIPVPENGRARRSISGGTKDQPYPGGNDKTGEGEDDVRDDKARDGGDGSATPRLKRKKSPASDASFGDESEPESRHKRPRHQADLPGSARTEHPEPSNGGPGGQPSNGQSVGVSDKTQGTPTGGVVSLKDVETPTAPRVFPTVPAPGTSAPAPAKASTTIPWETEPSHWVTAAAIRDLQKVGRSLGLSPEELANCLDFMIQRRAWILGWTSLQLDVKEVYLNRWKTQAGNL